MLVTEGHGVGGNAISSKLKENCYTWGMGVGCGGQRGADTCIFGGGNGNAKQ